MSCNSCQCSGHAAHKPHGATHWLYERVTSIALVPLCLWLVWSILTLGAPSYAAFTLWLAEPVNTWMLAATIVVGFWHGMMGMQVILEDYVSGAGMRCALIILMKLFFTALMIASLYSVYVIAN